MMDRVLKSLYVRVSTKTLSALVTTFYSIFLFDMIVFHYAHSSPFPTSLSYFTHDGMTCMMYHDS